MPAFPIHDAYGFRPARGLHIAGAVAMSSSLCWLHNLARSYSRDRIS